MNTSPAPALVAPSHIHLAVHKCARGFRDLITALTVISRFAAQTPPETINDELDRFKIWVGNLAAHRQGRRSLEYRLRDAAHLKSEVNDLLQALQNSLAKALAIVNGERIPWDEESDSDSDSESDSKVSDDAGNENPNSDTELKHILTTIKSTVTCLFRLSKALRDPAPNTQLRNFITVDKSYFETYDIPHVQSKFPQAEVYLTERLGRAMTGRRRYLAYREEHHQKLTKHVEEIGYEEPRTEHTTNSTEASLLPLANAKTGSVIDDGFDNLSQTSHATSVNATIRVPPLPKKAWDNEQWECSFCYHMVSIHTMAGWKQHVYRDLHPYCCTFEDCTIADRLYDSRRTWFQHELGHRKCWQCVEGCNRSFSSEKDFVAHIQAQHPDLTALDVLTALKHTATRSATLSDQGKCPLCNKSMTLRVLQKHLGRHQEQLALFALPQNMDETGDDEQDDESQASVDVNKWQDEELSDVSDTAHFGDDVESEVEDPLPRGATPETTLGKLHAIALHFHTEIVPPIMAFMQQQPEEESARILEYRRLSRTLLGETLLKLDDIETEKNSDAWTRRKELAREAQDLKDKLEETQQLICGHTTCGKLFYGSAYLRRHYEKMHGGNEGPRDITEEREEQKRKDAEAQANAEEDRLRYEWELKLEREERKRKEAEAQVKAKEDRLRYELELELERDERQQMLPRTPEQAIAEKNRLDQEWDLKLERERRKWKDGQPPASQQRTVVMPDRMRWIYRDPEGKTQGPFSGLEMHDWYIAGFFPPELLVRRFEEPNYEPLAQLIRRIGNSREPFLIPQIGIPHGPPTTQPGNVWAGSSGPSAGPASGT